MQLIFEDNHLLVAVKPPNLPTQPSKEHEKSFQTDLQEHLGRKFLQPIHRLDRPVGGLVLFAKSSKALSRLSEAMRSGKIRRFYRAQVEGNLQGEGNLIHYLLKEEHRAVVVPKGTPEAKEARLHYASRGEWVDIELGTGRYHQIRAQFAAIGHPVRGDAKYGSKTSLPHIALQCVRIQCPHPISQAPLDFFLPIP